MRRTIFHGLLRIIEFQEAELDAGCERIPPANAVEDFQIIVFPGFVENSVMPEDRRPVVDRRCFHPAQGCSRDLEIRKLFDRRLDHRLERVELDVRDIMIHAFDFETERRGEILFVADHHIHVFRNLAVDLPRLREAADGFP